MNIQDLGSIGELIAALATLLTLGYLAIQLKQNTSALKSQTFQQSSMDMSLTANSVSSDGELARIIMKAEKGIASLTPDEKLRFHFWMLVAVRRFEAIYIQALYGSIEKKELKDLKLLFYHYCLILEMNGGIQQNQYLVRILSITLIKIFHQENIILPFIPKANIDKSIFVIKF